MDIFKWITGQLPVPERVDSDVMRRLQVTPPLSARRSARRNTMRETCYLKISLLSLLP